jgi:hypothetical protein
MRRPLCRMSVWLRTLFLCVILAAGAVDLAPPAWAQSPGASAGTSATPQGGDLDNSYEYATDPTSREPSATSRYLAGAAVVAGAFVVGVIAAGTAVGGLVAAGAAGWFYATMP